LDHSYSGISYPEMTDMPQIFTVGCVKDKHIIPINYYHKGRTYLFLIVGDVIPKTVIPHVIGKPYLYSDFRWPNRVYSREECLEAYSKMSPRPFVSYITQDIMRDILAKRESSERSARIPKK
jgi:hypothetical protein